MCSRYELCEVEANKKVNKVGNETKVMGAFSQKGCCKS